MRVVLLYTGSYGSLGVVGNEHDKCNVRCFDWQDVESQLNC